MNSFCQKLQPLSPHEWGRKLLHAAALILPVLMMIMGKHALWFLIPLAVTGLACDRLRARVPEFAEFIHGLLGPLMRDSELQTTSRRVIVNGGTWICCAAVALGLIFPVRIAAAALAMHLVSDAAAALIGQSLGRHRWPGSLQTVEGSAAYFAVAFVTMTLWPGIPLWMGAITALLSTASEIPRGPLNDNLRVPPVAAVSLVALSWL